MKGYQPESSPGDSPQDARLNAALTDAIKQYDSLMGSTHSTILPDHRSLALTGTGFQIVAPCVEHCADPATLEFVDDQIAGKCQQCGIRLTMNRLPGGMSLLRIKHLVGEAVALSEHLDQGDDLTPQVVAELSAVRESLENEERAVQQARKLFEIAERLISRSAFE